MSFENSPFHKIRGWKILILLVMMIAYSTWYATVGPFGHLAALGPGLPLEERFFYTGAQAVEALSPLDHEGRKAKFISLIFDIPNMILAYLLFKALIAFGIRHLNLTKAFWNFLFILPLAFLFADFAEDSFIALTLATHSEVLGSIAGVMTAIKFVTYIAAAMTGLILSLLGIVTWFRKGRSLNY